MRSVLVVALVVGCGANAAPSGTAPAGSSSAANDECNQLVVSAMQELGRSYRDGRECNEPKDCKYANVSLSCRPGCIVSVNQAKVSDVEAARARIEASQCAQFVAKGCTVSSGPPCERPLPPECEKGRCY